MEFFFSEYFQTFGLKSQEENYEVRHYNLKNLIS